METPPTSAAVDAAGPRPPRVLIEVSAGNVAKALLVALLILLAILVSDAIISILLSGVFILGLDPPVSALERRGMGRGKAALLVFGAIGLGVVLIVWLAVSPFWNGVQEFADNLPGYIDEIADAPGLKELQDNTEVLSKLREAVADAAKSLPDVAIGLLGAAGTVFGSLLSLVTLAFLTLFGIISRPALTRSALELLPPPRAERIDATLRQVIRAMSGALIGNVVISVIAASVVGVTAVIVGAPSPAVLAVIVGLFDLVPQIGSTVAAVIVVAVTLVAAGPVPALILLIVILVYQQVENYLIQPAVMKQAVQLSPYATIASVIVGSSLLGIPGAILAVPVAASLKVVARAVTADRRARMAALRAQAQPEGA